MEAEMKAVFDQKVHEKETKLKQSEDDVSIKQNIYYCLVNNNNN